MTAKYNLVCNQSTTFTFQFVIQNDANGVSTPWNLTNYTATMTVRPFVGSTTTTVVASTANSRITLGGATGRVTVTIDDSVTQDIDPGRYAYDFVLDSGSVVTRILEGVFVVTGAVTNP